ARSVSDGVKGEFAKIRAPKDQLIVLTNRRATIPLALTSGTTYKVWVKVGLESDKLAFKDGLPCHTSSLPAQTTCLTLELMPGAQTVPVKATANFTGSFHVQVDLLTDTSAPARISTGRLSIRSTAYNVVALALMAAAALIHPNIVAVYDTGQHDEAPYVVMEYVAGGSLASRLGHGPLPPAEVSAIGAEVCTALAYAHRVGVVHRDLKPDNILISE